jgi:hypothetical protein
MAPAIVDDTGIQIPKRVDRADRQQRFLDIYASGAPSCAATARELGINIRTYQSWRQTDPNFRRKVDAIRASRNGIDLPGDQTDFATFRKQYLGLDSYAHHLKIVEVLETIEPGEIALINVYPEAGKTTLLEDKACHILSHEPNTRIVFLSQSSGLGRKSLGRIKQRMTDSRNFGEFIARYGPFYVDSQERDGKPWAADYITVFNSDHDERDYSIETRAISSAAYGQRIDYLIVDDVISDQNVAQSEKIMHTIRQTYFTRGMNMKIIIIGTRIRSGDLYEQMLDADLIDHHVTIPCIQGDGVLTCPEMWSSKEPDEYASKVEMRDSATKNVERKRRQVGETVWWTSYQQTPHVAGLATFTEDMVDAAKDTLRSITRDWRQDTDPAGISGVVVTSLDPALGGGNALVTAAHLGNELRIMDAIVTYGLARTEDILLQIREHALLYRPVLLIIEDAAFQKGLVYDDRLRRMGHELGFRVVPHQSSRAKHDPMLGVATMAGSMLRGEISVPWGNDLARARMEPLCAQLRAWRPNMSGRELTQDIVMAMWFNWKYWMEARGMIDRDVHSSWRRPGLPTMPTRAPGLSLQVSRR